MRYGLIAGNGRFPFMVVEGARKAGVSLCVAAIREETDPKIEQEVESLTWVGIGQLGKMIRFFKGEGVEKAIMAGQGTAALELLQDVPSLDALVAPVGGGAAQPLRNARVSTNR